MRIAVAGKGGAGKTTFTATAARHLARAGRTVLAIDGDTNPNLAPALGIAPAALVDDFLPTSLVSRRFDGAALTATVDDVLDRHAVTGPDGVRLLRMGMPQHAEEGCLCSAHAIVNALLADLADRPDVVTLLDLEASPEHLSRGTARHADVLVLVAEPYFRSLEAVRLQGRLAAETTIGRVVVVANKCRRPDDRAAIEEFCERNDLAVIGAVPFTEAVLDADADGRSLVDVPAGADVVAAIASVVDSLLTEEVV